MTTMPTDFDPATNVAGALALELVPGSDAAHADLEQTRAGALAALVARDLARHAPAVATLDCALVAAHYDPVELLRPGWPLHAALAQYAARAPRDGMDGARIVAFGSHDGRLPDVLQASDEFRGGPLRVMPFVLSGEASTIAGVSGVLETELVERGMAAADTALEAQAAFGMQVEHARYLTLHDLCAMTALQYEHVGLGPLWPVLETALLAPSREAWLDAAPEPLVHYRRHEACIALFAPNTWRERYAPGEDDEAALSRRFAHFEARQRQFASVLAAHGVAVAFAHCAGSGREALAD